MTPDGPPRPSWMPKPRLPTDPVIAPGGNRAARTAVLVIYAVAFFAMAGAAAVMAFARGFALTTPQVLIPALGAVWFLVRIMMVARPRPR